MGPAERTGRRVRHVNHVHITRKTLNVLGRPFQQQGITNPHNQFIQLTADILVPTVHSKRINTVAAAQTQRAKGAANHLAPRRNQHFDGRRFHG